MILDTGTIGEGHSVVRQKAELVSVQERMPSFGETIECEATIDRTGPTLYVQLWFKGSFDQECARCCKVFSYPVVATLSLVVQESESKYGQAAEDDVADFYFDTGHRSVDLAPVIFDEVMTSLPLKPLCSETCKGVTVTETTEESRNDPTIDPRWEALLKLKKK